jgi:hypothetical protein
MKKCEMTAVQNAIEDYVLGNSRQEQERLKLQAGLLEKWTEQFLVLALHFDNISCHLAMTGPLRRSGKLQTPGAMSF